MNLSPSNDAVDQLNHDKLVSTGTYQISSLSLMFLSKLEKEARKSCIEIQTVIVGTFILDFLIFLGVSSPPPRY